MDTSSFTAPEKRYTYSDPITLKKWNGGEMWVQVGYVKDHPEHNQVVLFKRYTQQGGYTKEDKYYISGQKDWVSIKTAVEQLWPELQEESVTADMIATAVTKVSQEMQLLELLARYPDIMSSIPEDVDIFSLPADQKAALRQLLAAGGSIAQSVIKKLSDQPVRDLQEFDRILEELRLSTVNGLVNHVRSRISFINVFEQAIHNDSTYERQGQNSVHNLLKSNIWIIDQNYSVLHDDETMKRIIQEQFERQLGSEEAGRTRPDFLCMASRRIEGQILEQIIIIEIKRPSVLLTMQHMEQLIGYRTILDRYSEDKVRDFKCYLIGRELDPVLASAGLSSAGYMAKTYTDFIAEARQFYEEYLAIVESDENAL